MRTIRVESITIYPIKSLAGIDCQSAKTCQTGFEHDRRWMVVDSSGEFLTQRTHPELASLRPEASGEHWIVRAPDGTSISLPVRPEAGERLVVRVWKDELEAWTTHAEADAWISEQLETPARFVYMPSSARRSVSSEHDPSGEASVSFADGFAFMVISQASLDALNERLETPLTMARFRPNFTLSGCEPFEEDIWTGLEHPTEPLRFHCVKPCSRCSITTLDPRTGTRTGGEPLTTLASFRQREGKVYFGQNLTHQGQGALSIGDELRILV